MPDTTPMRRPGTAGKAPMRPRRPMKICPDGSRTFADRMCPRIRRPIPSRSTSMSRAEQFKRERLGK